MSDGKIIMNWEQSPVNRDLIRYHIIVEGKKRKEILTGLKKEIFGDENVCPVQALDSFKGKYCFESYDSSLKPREIDEEKFGVDFEIDLNLREDSDECLSFYVAKKYMNQ